MLSSSTLNTTFKCKIFDEKLPIKQRHHAKKEPEQHFSQHGCVMCTSTGLGNIQTDMEHYLTRKNIRLELDQIGNLQVIT